MSQLPHALSDERILIDNINVIEDGPTVTLRFTQGDVERPLRAVTVPLNRDVARQIGEELVRLGGGLRLATLHDLPDGAA